MCLERSSLATPSVALDARWADFANSLGPVTLSLEPTEGSLAIDEAEELGRRSHQKYRNVLGSRERGGPTPDAWRGLDAFDGHCQTRLGPPPLPLQSE